MKGLLGQASSLSDNLRNKMVSENHVLTYEPEYNSREMQIINNQFLNRDMNSIVSAPNDNIPSLHLGNNDYLTFDYQINTPDISYNTYFAYSLTCTAVDFHNRVQMNEVKRTENTGIFLDELVTTNHDYEEIIDLNTQTEDFSSDDTIGVFPDKIATRALPIIRDGSYDFTVPLPYANFKILKLNKQGSYDTIAESQKNETKASIHDIRLSRFEKYRIEFTFDRSSSGKFRFGSFQLQTDFKPTSLIDGLNTILIHKNSESYAIFTPAVSDVYSFDFSETDPDIIIKVFDPAQNTTREVFWADNDREVFLEANKQYILNFANMSYLSAKELEFDFHVSDQIETDVPLHLGNADGRIFSYVPTWNGIYSLNFVKTSSSSAANVDVSIYNQAFEKIFNSDSSSSIDIHRYFESNIKYFFQVNSSSSVELDANLTFTPQETDGKGVYLSEVGDYEIIKFVPKLSGKYMLTLNQSTFNQQATKNIFNTSGINVTQQNLESNQVYYIKIDTNGEHFDHCKLNITLDSDQLQNNQPYGGYKTGNNTVSFIAPVTGQYKIDGLSNFVVMDDSLIALFDQNSNNMQLAEGTTYYIGFHSSNASSQITMRFAPPELDMMTNTILNNPSFYELNYPTANYVFSTKSLLSKNAKLSLYDNSLNLLCEGLSMIQYSLIGNVKYYLHVEIYGIDTMLSVSSDYIFRTAPKYTFHEGIIANFTLEANSKRIYSFTYPQTLSTIRYYLKLNEVLGEQVEKYIEYKDTSGELHRIPLTSTGKAGEYYCDLEKAHGTYYITINTINQKQVEFDFFVPTRIEEILLNGKNISTYITKPLLGIGFVYNYQIIVNSEATYPAFIDNSLSTNLITYGVNQFTIKNDPTKKGYNVELKFKSKYDTDYKMYSFILEHAYSAVASIENNEFLVSFVDLYGDPTTIPIRQSHINIKSQTDLMLHFLHPDTAEAI